MRYEELTIEGRNAVIEAFRSGKTIDRVFILDNCQDGPIMTIKREAKKTDCLKICFQGTPGSDVGNRKASGSDCLCSRL